MENELALVPQFHAVAVNATEMQAAKEGIKVWLQAKVSSIAATVDETWKALDSATRNGWATKTLRSAFQREKQRHLYYGKLLAAVEAGFTIVPNMDVDVFAIRVKREKPIESVSTTNKWNSTPSHSTPSLNDETEQRLAIGDGRYESPVQRVSTKRSTSKDEYGEVLYTTTVTATAFADLEFPLAVAHSVVMDATAQAMSLKLFDRIGVVPQTKKGRPDRARPNHHENGLHHQNRQLPDRLVLGPSDALVDGKSNIQVTVEKCRALYEVEGSPKLLQQITTCYRITIREFASIFGISKAHAEDIIKHRKFPALDLAVRISRYFECTVEDLFAWRVDDDGKRRPLLIVDPKTGVAVRLKPGKGRTTPWR